MRTIAVFTFMAADSPDLTVYATDNEACEARMEVCDYDEKKMDEYPIHVLDIPASEYERLECQDDLKFSLCSRDGSRIFFTGSLEDCVNDPIQEDSRIVLARLTMFEKFCVWPKSV